MGGDDSETFDPYKRWAKVNNQPAVRNPIFDKYPSPAKDPSKLFLSSKHGQIWTFLHEPKTILEISEQIHTAPDLIKYMLDELESIYGVRVEKIKEHRKIAKYLIPHREIRKLKLS